MNQLIIYPTIQNQIAIVIPANSDLTIEDIVLKDVPIGSKYLIIDANDIPNDRSQRQAWTADFTNAAINSGVKP